MMPISGFLLEISKEHSFAFTCMCGIKGSPFLKGIEEKVLAPGGLFSLGT